MLFNLRNQKRKIAAFLAVIFIFNIVAPFASYSRPVTSGSSPIAESLAKYVDPFTGDFNYSIPLLNVSGPNGENFPVNINYSAGIGMNDEASWVGLGWNLGVGEISRTVMGVADDYEKASQQTIQVKQNQNNNGIVFSNNTTNYYGPLYWNSFPYEDNKNTIDDDSASMDIYQSSRLMNSWYYGDYDAFEAPDYDKYYISGSGLSGEMTPRLFQYARLMQKNSYIGSIGDVYKDVEFLYDKDLVGVQDQKFTKSLEFRLNSEFTEIATNSYNNAHYFSYPESSIITPNTSTTEDSKSKFKTDNNTLVTLTNEAPKGNIVRYFTNAEISFSRNSLVTNRGFLDYQKITDYNVSVRNPIEFPQNGIGAFQIISTDGKVYHYSLPVYENSSETNSFSFLNTSLTDVDDKPYDKLNPNSFYTRYSNQNKYATSWKLTAITGLNYEDKNQDGVANEGDSGYWISFDYGLWSNEFQTTFPFYNYTTLDLLSQYTPSVAQKEYQKYGVSNYKYERSGAYTKSNQQLYYLNAIHTATESAYFVKDVRYDAHSNINMIGGQTLVPKLKLVKIILVKNDQVNQLTSKSIKTSSADFGMLQLGNKSISTSSIFNNNIIDVKDYELNKNALENNALKLVEFVTDYSLCKKLYNNAYNNFNTIDISASTLLNNYTYKKATYLSTETGQENNSGKLTLKSIQFKEYKTAQIFPSYIFNYDESNPIKNPDYNPDKQDFWGYYKNDFNENYRGHYTTQSSKDDVDAWSLKKITTPIGAEISMDYESDQYNWIGFDDNYGKGNIRPNRSFLIYDIEKLTGTTHNVKAHFIDKDAISFLKLTSSSTQPNISNYLTSIPLKSTSDQSDISFVSNLLNLSSQDLNTISIDNNSDGNHMLIKMPESKLLEFENQGYFNAEKYRKSKYNGFLNLVLSYVYGGGVRIKTIKIREPESNAVYSQNYNYSEGIATSEPDWFNLPKSTLNSNLNYSYELQSSNINSERHKINPSVGYTNVQVRNVSLVGNANGIIEYKFNNYKEPYYPIISSKIGTDNCGNNCKKVSQISIIADSNAAFYGTLSEIISKDNYGNVLRKVNKYYRAMGLNEEAFFTLYRFKATSALPGNIGERLIKKVSITRNYTLALRKEILTENSIEKEILENVEFNSLSGQATKIRIKDFSEGIKEITTTPAYKMTENSGMGSRLNVFNNSNDNELNDNNLMANGETEIKHIRVSSMPNDGVAESEKLMVGGENNIWTNNRAVFKFLGQTSSGYPIYGEQIEPSSYYTLNSNRIYNGETNSLNWKKKAEINLYDENGNVIQSTSGKNNFSSMIYDNRNREIASAKNVKRAHFTYSSFEDYNVLPNGVYDFGSSVFGSNGEYRFNTIGTQIKAHTGNYVVKVGSGQYGPNFMIHQSNVNELENKVYVAKVWVHNSSPANAKLYIKIKGKIGSTPYEDYIEVSKIDSKNLVVGDWVLMKVSLSIPPNFKANDINEYLNVGVWNTSSNDARDAYYDDLMCSPIDANVIGTIYNPITNWVVAAINNDGMASYKEYDAAGRVTYIKKETEQGVKTVSQQRYNFAR